MIYTFIDMPTANTTASAGVSRWKLFRRTLGAVAGFILALSLTLQAPGQSGSSQPPTPHAPTPTTGSIPAARFAKNVVIITIHRQIDETMARSVQRRLNEAVESKADAVVFDINTPGGQVGAVLEITQMIKTSPIPNTIAWINRHAYSGGAIIGLACREMITSDVARFGDAAPISGMPSPTGGPISLSETERQKILSPLLAEVVDSARRRNYDEKLVQGMLVLGVELWLVENIQTGEKLFIDRHEHELLFGQPPHNEAFTLASGARVTPRETPADAANAPTPTSNPSPLPLPGSPTDFIPAGAGIQENTAADISLALSITSKRPVLTPADAGKWRKIEKVSDGNTIFTFTDEQLRRYALATAQVKTDEELKTFIGATNMHRLDESWSEALVLFLTNMIVRGVLIVIFLVAFFIEMTHPGVMIPGLVAIVALILLVAPPMLNNMASWWEIAAMLVGVALLLMEIFVVPGFGVCGVLGILLFFGGLVGTFIGTPAGGLFPDSSAPNSQLTSAILTVGLAVVTSIGIMWFFARNLGSIPMLNKLVLMDQVASESGGLLAAMERTEGPLAKGDVGQAVTPLRPAGRVQVGDQIYDVVSDFGFVPAGARVRVVAVDQFRVSVEPIRDGDDDSQDGATA